MTWRIVLLLLCAGLFSACSSEMNRDENLAALFSRNTEIPVASAQFTKLAQAKAPAVLVSIKDRNQIAAFLRATSRNGVENWIGANVVSLDFKSGILVASRGLGDDLMAADVAQSSVLILSGHEGFARRFHSYLNGEDQIVTRSYICEIKSRGYREVDLGKRSADTQLMQEKCNNGEQVFQNLYWVEQGPRAIVQSRQWISDSIGAVAVRKVLR